MIKSNEKSNEKSTINVINIEKKQSYFGLIQDIMTLLYCFMMIPLSMLNIVSNMNNFTLPIYLISYIYFIATGFINLYYLEYNFVIHHVICLNLIFLLQFYNNEQYMLWLSYCFMSEISNIFLSMKNILKHVEKIFAINLKNIHDINNILFLISYFGIRICYLLPLSYQFFRLNYNKLLYKNFILLNTIIMYILNLYWAYLIIKKVHKMIKKYKLT